MDEMNELRTKKKHKHNNMASEYVPKYVPIKIFRSGQKVQVVYK